MSIATSEVRLFNDYRPITAPPAPVTGEAPLGWLLDDCPLTTGIAGRGRDLLHQGETCERFVRIQKGWAGVYHLLEDGRRRIIGIALPGDVVGVGLWPGDARDFGVMALTDLVFEQGRNSTVLGIARGDPTVGLALCANLQAHANEARRFFVVMASRCAIERIAHLLMGLALRLLNREPEAGDRTAIPLTQQAIGDATGMSYVHVNRVLRQLREAGILILQNGMLTVWDPERFAKLAHLDADGYFENIRHLSARW